LGADLEHRILPDEQNTLNTSKEKVANAHSGAIFPVIDSRYKN
jgi:hypothetical protein